MVGEGEGGENGVEGQWREGMRRVRVASSAYTESLVLPQLHDAQVSLGLVV